MNNVKFNYNYKSTEVLDPIPENKWYIPSQQMSVAKISQVGIKGVADPILSCEEHEQNYKVYLAVTEEGEKKWEKDSAKDQVTFKVVDEKNGKKLVWGPGALEGDKWTNWSLRFDHRGEVKLNVPSDGKTYKEGDYKAITCQETKVERDTGISGIEVTIHAVKTDRNNSELKVEVDTQKCTEDEAEGKEECDIKFVTGINLGRVSQYKVFCHDLLFLES